MNNDVIMAVAETIKKIKEIKIQKETAQLRSWLITLQERKKGCTGGFDGVNSAQRAKRHRATRPHFAFSLFIERLLITQACEALALFKASAFLARRDRDRTVG